MSATTRPRLRPTRRGVARGSAVGIGLLVATTAVAPAALAEDSTTGDPAPPDTAPEADVPTAPALNAAPAPTPAVSGPINADFGRGKQFDLGLAVDGDAPPDLDRSGVQFALTPSGGAAPAATCVTDSNGGCTITWEWGRGTGSVVSVPDGTYTVTQVTAVDGLTPVAGPVGTLTVDSSYWPDWGMAIHHAVAVTNVSEYSRHVTGSVVDATTGDPVAGASFGLTGPGYAGSAATFDAGTAVSDAAGELTFDGWFRPGDWTLTPGSVPDGYVLGDPVTLPLSATPGFAAPATWALADPVEVAPLAPPAEDPPATDGPVVDPSGDPSPPAPPVVVPPLVPPAPVAPSPAPSHPSSSPSGQRAAAPAVPVVASPAPAEVPVAPTAAPTSTGRSSLPQEDRAPNTDPAPATLAGATDLKTVSSSFPQVGLVGLGILFVAIIAGGIVLVRRRAHG